MTTNHTLITDDRYTFACAHNPDFDEEEQPWEEANIEWHGPNSHDIARAWARRHPGEQVTLVTERSIRYEPTTLDNEGD